MKYKILPHPAELRVRVYGKNIEELFSNAAEAMADILQGVNRKAQRIKRAAKKEKMKIKSTDINSLLVDFLNEVLAKSQIEKKVYKLVSCKLRVLKNQFTLEGELLSAPVGHFDEDIKAVTHQDVNIKLETSTRKSRRGVGTPTEASGLKTKRWRTDIVFDI